MSPRGTQPCTGATTASRRKKNLIWTKNYFSMIRNLALAKYGGPICVCCGELEVMFLTLDHINNDGAKHRKEIGTGRSSANFYLWLYKRNFPKLDLQVMCHNCNTGRYRNGGICPHKVLKDES